MRPIRTENCNKTLTLPGGTEENDLPACLFMGYDQDAGETIADARAMWETAWMPTEDEAARIEAGAPIILRVEGQAHPPVLLTVAQAVVPERELIDRSHVERAVGYLYAALGERISTQARALGAGGMVRSADVLPTAPEFADLWGEAVKATMQAPDAPTIEVPDAPPAEWPAPAGGNTDDDATPA